MFFSVDRMKTVTKNGENYLYCEKNITSSYGEEYIQFVIEQKSLSPVLPVFSSLRNSFIDVDTFYDIEKVIAEDINYKEIIDAFLHNLHDAPRKQAEGILLRAFK